MMSFEIECINRIKNEPNHNKKKTFMSLVVRIHKKNEEKLITFSHIYLLTKIESFCELVARVMLFFV